MTFQIKLHEKSVRLRNGVTLRYAEQGDQQGTPVLLVHGYPDSWRSYRTVMAHLPGKLRVIAPSLRGYGESDATRGVYHPRDLAADLDEFMGAVGVPAAYLVGHSMGSYVAEYLALDHPERVRGLALIGTFRTLVGRADMAEFAVALERMGERVDEGLIRAFQQDTLMQPIPEAVFEAIVAESLKVPAHVLRGAYGAMLEIDHFDQLGRIKAPAHIFWGDKDGMSTLRDQHDVAAALGGELTIYAGAGHSLQWEEPQRFARDLVKFIGRIEDPGVPDQDVRARPGSQHRR